MQAHRFRQTLIASALAALLPAAQAQTAPAAAPKDPSDAVLPVIVVQGQREGRVTASEAGAGVLGDLPLLKTPFSINVITRELLDVQQAAFLGDFLKNDPSATVGNVAVPFVMLRGFSVGTDGELYDGLPGHNGLSDGRVGLQGYEQVETLKGASAMLYGVGSSTSLGGVVNHVPKRPTDTPLRSVGFGVTSNALFSVDADLGDRFGNERQFGYRLNLGLRDGEQAVDRYDWTQNVAALALDWRVRPGLVLNIGFDHVDNHNPELPPFFLVAQGVDVPDAPDMEHSAALSWDNHKTNSDNLYVRADWDLSPDWSFTAQALRNLSDRPEVKRARFGMILNDEGDAMLFGGQSVSSVNTSSGQALLHGKLKTGDIGHALTFGVSGMSQRSYYGATDFGVFMTNIYEPADSPEPAALPITNAPSSRVLSSSLLVSDILDFSEQWSALLGARRARLSVENFGSPTDEATKTLPTVALMYKPMADALLYANYAEGLEMGGDESPIEPGRNLPPRQTKQFEIGAKLDHAGVSYTAALFDMRRPLEALNADTGLNEQRGTQRHRGIEMMASGRVLPALTLVTGVMLLDTELSDTGDAGTEGKRAVGVPRLTANVWGEYRVAAAPGLALNAGVYHVSKQYLDAANTQQVPGWTRLDLGASYRSSLNGIPALWLLGIENVADKNYWASSHTSVLTSSTPRTIKLGARLSF